MKLNQKSEQYQICRVCGYDRNDSHATQCEACKFSLVRDPITDPLNNLPALLFRSRTSVAAIVLSLLVIAASGTYLVWTSMRSRTNPVSTAIAPKSLQSGVSSDGLQIIYNSFQEVPNVPSGLFNYGGALLFAPLRTPTVVNALAQAQPQFRLRYTEPLTGPGSRKGVAMLIDGQLAFSTAAQPVKEEEYALARGRGFKLQSVPVAIDEVVFFANPKLNISGLSVDQLRGIYTGKIKNWKVVGGPDLRIIPITLNPKDSSTMRMLTEDLPGGIKNVRAMAVRDYTESIRLTGANIGGISYGSASTVIGQKTIRPLPLAKGSSKNYVAPFTDNGKVNTAAVINNSYPLSRRIFIVIRRDGTTDESAGVAYANLLRSKAGQKLVEQMGFVPLF